MRDGVGFVVALVVIAIVLLGGGVIITEYSYRMSEHYAPRIEDVRRSTFEHSRAFQEGNARELRSIRRDYELTKDAGARATLRETALHIIDGIDRSTLPPDLRSFADNLETAQ